MTPRVVNKGILLFTSIFLASIVTTNLTGRFAQTRWDGAAMIGVASTAITLALVFYTIGVFAERRSGTLNTSHLVFFYLGLACDTAGTAVMSNIARGESANPTHAATGLLAIILMIIHAAWASVVLARKNRAAMESFHRFSVAVWTIWLIPYFCGMLMGIPAIDLSANAAFGTALIGVGVIGLILYLRGDARRA